MRNTIPKIFQEYSTSFIGIEYSELDCWQLVDKFYEVIFKEALPKFNYIDAKNYKVNHILGREYKQSFNKVSIPRFGDIILIRIHGLAAHVGIYLNEEKFLHTSGKTGSMIDSLGKWKTQIEGFYRYDKN